MEQLVDGYWKGMCYGEKNDNNEKTELYGFIFPPKEIDSEIYAL